MPQLVVDNGPDRGQKVPVTPDQQVVVGRDSSCGLPLKDPLISRRHCRIVITPTAAVLEDLKSVNGTFHNGNKLKKRVKITDGDRVQVGETILTFFENEAEDPLIGKTISGFEVIERVGSGGMGNVYRARQLSLDRFVALKVLSKDLAENRKFIELFHREARSAGQINHPSLVQVYDVDTVKLDSEEVTFFAMEFMPGGSVEDLLASQKRLELDQALQITLDTARGLAFAEQRGLVHRDIKPGNLMFSETGMIKIGDLGIARRGDAGGKVSQKDGISGSPHYIAPEQAQGKDIDTRADIYSLGISLFHMLSGRPPFMGTSAKELVLKHVRDEPPPIKKFCQKLPQDAVKLINKMIAKDPEDRHASAAVLVQEIEQLQEKVQSGGIGKKRPLMVTEKGKKTFKVAALLLFIAILGSIGTIAFFVVKNESNKARQDYLRYRSDLEYEIREAQNLLASGKAEEAEAYYRRNVQGLVDLGHERADDLAPIYQKASEIQKAIEEQLAREREALLEKEAREDWAEIAASIPVDLAASESLEGIEASLEQIAGFLREHGGREVTSEATEAREQLGDALDELRKRLRTATREYRQVELNADSYLANFQYNFAIEALREFLENHPDTPEHAMASERLGQIEKSMSELVAERVQAVERAGNDAERLDAIGKLEALRRSVEGAALKHLENSLEKFRGES